MNGKKSRGDSKAPECIGVIVDGNRRWALERGLPKLKGHEAGYKKLKEMADWAQEVGIKTLIAYVFSSQNWNRSKDEVDYLMDLVGKVFTDDLEYFKKRNARIKVTGDLSRCTKKVRDLAMKSEEETKDCDDSTLVLAFSYGGREEIVAAANKLLNRKIVGEVINEEDFSNALWTSGIPDPDIIIRTSGEMRLSNFLPWQSVYAELFFPKFYFPDFTKEAFLEILKEFNERQRRFGR